MTSSCSVVMVSFHTGETLFASIRLALAQEGLAELIVVSNGNPPADEARLQEMASRLPKLKIIIGQGNVGFAAGCNLGAAAATGDFLLMLNPDALLPPKALVRAMHAMRDYPEAMMASCQLLNPDGTAQRGSRRNLLTPASALAESLIFPRLLGLSRLNLHEAGLPDVPVEVPAVSGAFMLFRRADFDALGGMDQGYFLHVEDLDICQRVHAAGRSILFVPSVRVVHLLSTSDVSGTFIERCKAAGFRRYFDKHFRGRVSPLLLQAVRAAITLRLWLKLATIRPRCWRKAWRGSAAENRRRALELLLRGFAEGEGAPSLRGRTVLVTGASSPLGMATIGRLLAAGAGVMAVSRNPSICFEHPCLSQIGADIEKPSSVLSALEYDSILHCAPLWLLERLTPTLRKAGCQQIVAFGSTSIVGKAQTDNNYEQDVVARLQLAEAALERSGLRWTLLRPTLIYGGGLDRNISRLAKVIRRFGFCALYPPASGLRQPVHALDLAQAATAALHAPVQGAYNVSGGETLSYRAMVERLFAAIGRTPRLLFLSQLPLALNVAGRMLPASRINGEMARRQNRDLIFAHDEAARDLGFAPRAFLTNPRADLPL